MNITISSFTGSGEDSCLNVVFANMSNFITCAADVVGNLLAPPNIIIMNGNSTSNNTKNFSLIHNISSTDTGEFTCRVCIEVPEAGIVDHCTNDTVTLSRDCKYTDSIHVAAHSICIQYQD